MNRDAFVHSLQSTAVKESENISSLQKAEEDKEITLEKNALDESAAELYLERETSSPDFGHERIYDVDSFGEKSYKLDKRLAPPPSFQKALQALSPDLQKDFKKTLNGNIVGIWPIKQAFLLK